MSQEPLLVNVSSRGIPLITRAVLEPSDGGEGFLKTDAPLPVGTELVLKPVEQADSPLLAQVSRVVEARKSVRGPNVPPAGMHLVLAEDSEPEVEDEPVEAAVDDDEQEEAVEQEGEEVDEGDVEDAF